MNYLQKEKYYSMTSISKNFTPQISYLRNKIWLISMIIASNYYFNHLIIEDSNSNLRIEIFPKIKQR